jgi:phosphoenolpyruvate carboxylase
MISVTAVTDNYILQAPLLHKHKDTLEWLSAAVLWKRELAFFQKLLDKYAPQVKKDEDKKKLEHFQNVNIYYRYELIDTLTSRLRQHEKNLAEMLESRDETKIGYIKEHEGLMNELEAMNKQFVKNKEDLFSFVESLM